MPVGSRPSTLNSKLSHSVPRPLTPSGHQLSRLLSRKTSGRPRWSSNLLRDPKLKFTARTSSRRCIRRLLLKEKQILSFKLRLGKMEAWKTNSVRCSLLRVLSLKNNDNNRGISQDSSRSRLLRPHNLRISGKHLSIALLPSRSPSHLPPHNRVPHPRLRCNSSVSNNQQHRSSELKNLASNRPRSTCSRLPLCSF